MGLGSSGILYSGLATLNIELGSGADVFTIQNTAANATTNLTSAATTNADTIQVINDSGVTHITTGGGNDTVNVQATSSASQTVINTAGGTNDVVNLGSNAPNSTGVLGNLAGAISVTGTGSPLSLNLDDTGDTGATTNGVLTATTFNGLGTGGITYNHVGTLDINLGSGGNAFVIVSTNSGTTTNLNSGTGNDTITVQSDSGITNINSGAGNDVVTIQSDSAVTSVNTGAGNDVVNVTGTSAATGINTGGSVLTRSTSAAWPRPSAAARWPIFLAPSRSRATARIPSMPTTAAWGVPSRPMFRPRR